MASETQHSLVHVHPTQKKKYESQKISRKSTMLATERAIRAPRNAARRPNQAMMSGSGAATRMWYSASSANSMPRVYRARPRAARRALAQARGSADRASSGRREA